MKQNKLFIDSSVTDAVIRTLAAHPYLAALTVCLLINPFYLGACANVPNNALMIECILVFSGICFVFHRVYKSNRFEKQQIKILAAIFLCLIIIGAYLYNRSQSKGIWLFLGGSALLLLVYYNADTQKHKEQLTALLIIGISFMLKFYYVFYTSVYTRQQDVGVFGGEDSHAGYIEYLLFNHHLPDFDVRDRWQFCHPPLHHTISALWIYINENIFGVGHDPARESLQTLSLFYSMTIVISAYKIFKYFKLKGNALYIPLIITAFHPTFIILSGSINNDILSIAFVMGAVVCTLKWYENPTLKNILKIALCVGLGMMTKLSAALVAPPIAVVFLVVFIRKIKADGLKLLGQYAAFGAVCIPLALWFEIRNLIKFDVPITYVQEMDKNQLQYIGDQSFISRITDFSSHQLSSVFQQWAAWTDNGEITGYNEYNPLIALLKNSIFGEFINQNNFAEGSYILTVCTVLFWLAALIAAIAFTAMIVSAFSKKCLKLMPKLFMIIFWLVLIINFYKLAKDYPFTCSMNFRYITPTVIIGSLFYGTAIQRFSEKDSKLSVTAANVMSVLSIMFALLVSSVYVELCLPAY